MSEAIADAELRSLFRDESAEHLQAIESGLLELEHTPGDSTQLEAVFRAAHSLKGAARMLGLLQVQQHAHAIEDLLGQARQDNQVLSAQAIAKQLQTLDTIRSLIAQALGDAPAAAASAQPPKAAPSPAAPAPSPARVAQASGSAPTLKRPAEFHIDTLRVDASKLDRLLSQTAELVVTKGKVLRWSAELAALLAAHEAATRNGTVASTDWCDRLRHLHALGSAEAAELENICARLENGVYSLRLLPISTMLEPFGRMVHDLAAELHKDIALQIDGGSTVVDKRVIETMQAPLMHLLRNAIDHGIETAADRIAAGKPETSQLRIVIAQDAGMVEIDVIDDGRGLDFAAIRQQALRRKQLAAAEVESLGEAQLKAMLFEPGFSTSPMITDISGRGVGLKVVASMVEQLRGSIELQSTPGQGLRVRIRLPVTLTSTRVMLVRVQDQLFAIAFDSIDSTTLVQTEDLHDVEGQLCFFREDQPLQFERLGRLLGLPQPAGAGEACHAVVLALGAERFAIGVDALAGVEDIVLKPPGAPLRRVRHLLGLTMLSDGQVCPVLNVSDLLRSLQRSQLKSAPVSTSADTPAQRPLVLLAEDSITTRIQEKRILEGAGYDVLTAVDGLDAWTKLATHKVDAVVSDINMPNLDGLELTARIRAKPAWRALPVVLVTSLNTDADRKRGLELGADAFISKPDFDQTLLVDCLARLIGAAEPRA